MPAKPLHLSALWSLSVAAAATLGWTLRGPQPAAPTAPVAPIARPAAIPAPMPQPPLIALAPDGRVTLRVEQQPLEWVLEQIALQGGPALPVPAPTAAPTAPTPLPAGATAVAPNDAAPTWRHALAHGTEAERAEALLQAQAAGAVLPEALLRGVIQGAADERLRLAALEHWVLAHAGDARTERAALEQAQQWAGPVLQQEVRQRLDDLAQRERLDAEGARLGPQ